VNEQRHPTREEVESFMRAQRNWGRWGEDDQVGAINLVTAEKRLQSIGLVRTGQAVSLSREMPKTPAPNNPTPAQHFMRMNLDPAQTPVQSRISTALPTTDNQPLTWTHSATCMLTGSCGMVASPQK
jgi:hypothetical protein